MAVKPIRQVSKTITPANGNLVLLDDGVSMGKATLEAAVSAVAGPIVSGAIDDLDLGTAAQQNVEAFASASQGSKADSAVQPDDLGAVATSNDYGDLSNKPTLGTAAATDASDYATASQGSLADTALQPEEIGVTVGDMLAANNGSDFSSAPDVRKNIAVPVYVADRTAAKALDPTKDAVLTITGEGGRNGSFVWVTGDYSTQVAADTREGLFLKADGVAATSGAWVRQFNGPVDAAWFGVTADGTTDDAAALLAATAWGKPVRVPAGTVRIGTNTTLTNTIIVDRGSMLSVGSGVTLTINGSVDAGLYKIFTGDGDVKNLRWAYVDWFTSLVGTTTVANSDLQKAANSVRSQGTLYLQLGDFRVNGSEVLIPTGMDILGWGRESTRFFATTQRTALFDFQSSGGKTASGFSYYGPDFAYATRASQGTVINCTGSTQIRLDDIFMTRVWNGISYPGTNSKLHTIDIYNAINYGIALGNGYPDVFISQMHLYSIRAYVDVSDVSGTFESGEVITGLTSGNSNTFDTRSGDTLSVGSAPHKPYTVGETIQGATSGATAVVVRTAEPHASGALRLSERSEGHILEAVAIIGGRYGLLTSVTDNSPRKRPSFIRFTDLFVDSTRLGVQLDKTVDLTFENGWIASSGGTGCVIANSTGTKFVGTTFANNAVHGAQVNSSSKFTSFTGCKLFNNGSGSSTHSGIYVVANATDFSILGCQATNIADLTRSQGTGITVETGSSDRYIIANNLVSGNAVNGVIDGGSGSNKSVTANF